MAITPDELRQKTFSIVRKGFDQREVIRYLEALALELEAASTIAADEEIVVADVVEVEPVVDTPSLTTGSEATPVAHDEFDKVASEISGMLRHAQDSAEKIRSDAENDARALVEQVRTDIEADRAAHEDAAAELIRRTEERAGAMRTEAEEYSSRVRTEADEYVEARTRELSLNAEADRAEAESELKAAKIDAETTIEKAKNEAAEILARSEAEAKARADELTSQARATIEAFYDAEKSSRENLELARTNIENALAQLHVSEIADQAVSS